MHLFLDYNTIKCHFTAHTIVELCAIRDGEANCDVMSCADKHTHINSTPLHPPPPTQPLTCVLINNNTTSCGNLMTSC